MNKMITRATIMAFSMIFFAGSSFAQENMGYSEFTGAEPAATYGAMDQPTSEYIWSEFEGAKPAATYGAMSQSMGWDTIEASSLIGYQVWSPRTGSTELGQISDLVVDQSNGRIALVVLSDVPGLGTKKVAVPYASVVRGEGYFYINIPSENIGLDEGTGMGYNYRDAMAPGALPAVIDSNWAANIYRQYGLVPYWTEKGEEPSMELYTSSKLIGAEVQLPQGGAVGKVDDLVIDFSDGHIAFLTLSDVEERGGLVAVPFNILSRGGENSFVLNITKDKLADAPSFNGYTDMGNRAYAAGVYRFFGVQPYWTEDGM